VPGSLLGAEPAGDLLLDLRRALVSLGLVRGRGYAQVGGELEHVVFAVARPDLLGWKFFPDEIVAAAPIVAARLPGVKVSGRTWPIRAATST
jgi:hypothetical protein